MSAGSVFEVAAAALACAEPARKVALTRALRQDWEAGTLALAPVGEPEPIGEPGRPARPLLVPPRELVQRRLSSPEGRAALIHAVAHIEFNAINLALDAVYRFRAMPRDYYGDWLQVAAEEALHFELLRERLCELGRDYGDYPAHNGLWEMAQETAHDPLVRMALVPRVLEARGLDVTPGMRERLAKAGDARTVEILAIILRDEVGHVAIGSRWFKHLCAERALAPEPTFRTLLGEYMRGRLKGPFNVEARMAAGFSPQELEALQALDTD